VANNVSTGTIVINTATVADGSTLTVDSSAITTSSNTFTLDASAETDGILVVNGSAGIDTITMTQSDQADTLSLGGAADIIKVATANLTSVDTINGGAGTDILKMIDASTVIDADFTNVTNLESISQNTASHGMTLTLGSAALAAGLVTVTGGTGTNSVTVGSGYTGALTVALAAGTDTVNGSGQTSGSLTVTAAQDSITSADTITGGSATDALTITGGGTALAAADLANVTAFGTINTATNATFGITTSNNNVASGSTVAFNANSLTSAVLTFDASAEADGVYTVTATGSGNHAITGGSGADTITTGAGANTIIGGAGADTITSGTGADIITGGNGNDSIVLSAGADADVIHISAYASNGSDTITVFDTLEDHLNFDATMNVADVVAVTDIASAGSEADFIDNEVYVFATGDTAVTAGSVTITTYTDLAEVAAFISENLTSGTSGTSNDQVSGDQAIYVVNDLGNSLSYAYHFLAANNGDASAGDTVAEAELTLLATITEESGAALVAADII
jgi:Ca2+-binding RTX toxin-like protein